MSEEPSRDDDGFGSFLVPDTAARLGFLALLIDRTAAGNRWRIHCQGTSRWPSRVAASRLTSAELTRSAQETEVLPVAA